MDGCTGPDREQREPAGRDLGGGHGRKAECWTNIKNSGHAFNNLTQKGLRDQLKRTKIQVNKMYLLTKPESNKPIKRAS